MSSWYLHEVTHWVEHMTAGVTYPSLAQVFFRAASGCVSELQASMGVSSDLSPAWILAAARRFAPRLDALQHVLLLQPQLVTAITQQGSQQEMVRMRFSFSLLILFSPGRPSTSAIFASFVANVSRWRLQLCLIKRALSIISTRIPFPSHLPVSVNRQLCFWQIEDISALGVCVELAKSLPVTSLQECQEFVSRVEFLQPCLERAFGRKYRSLCSRGCLQELDSIRWV